MKPSRYKGFLAVLERTQQELAEGRISIDAAKLRILAEIAGAVCKIADEVEHGRIQSGENGKGSSGKSTSRPGK